MSKEAQYDNGQQQQRLSLQEVPSDTTQQQQQQQGVTTEAKKPWWHSVKEPGSAFQIVIAAVLAIAIGMAVTTTVDDIPPAAAAIIGIPGKLWLRSLRAVVLPMIITAIIIAVQRLKDMTRGGAVLAKWSIGYFIVTTLIAIFHSALMTGLVWSRLMTKASDSSLQVTSAKDQEEINERKARAVHTVVVDMFESFIPQNVVDAVAKDSLLAVLCTAVVVGYLLKPGSSILKAVQEVETIIIIVITFLIKLAPIGVFFLILPNLFQLDINDVGRNLGILMAGSLSSMFFHLFVVMPLIFFVVVRINPYSYWFKNSPAWITAWGSASSAATMPVTMRCVLERGVPVTVAKFFIPLGTLINMDGTAIYFPICVVFLAATQGQTLSPVDYIIICLLSTLSAIGTTPIPSSSLVLTVVIATSVNIEITGMYAVVVSIDWFLDRFRTALNVSGDLYGAAIITKITKITDPDDVTMDTASVSGVDLEGSDGVGRRLSKNDERV